MKEKRVFIVIIAVIVIAIISISGYLIFKETYKKPEKPEEKPHEVETPPKDSDPEFEKNLATLINLINKVNKIFNESELSIDGSYLNEKGDKTCYLYDKEDADVVYSMLSSIYLSPFIKGENFEVKGEGEETKLYFCKNEKTSINNIDINDVSISKDEEYEKNITIGEKDYILMKNLNGWQFVYTVGIDN